MRAAAINKLVANMLLAGLPATSISTVVDRPIYCISKPVCAFPFIKIVFLMVKLVIWGQQVWLS